MSSETAKRAGRPKDRQKRQAILEAARELFLAGDFDRVTMDEIANAAGVSKLTVYSHFGEKDVLFAEAVRKFAEEHLPPAMTDVDPSLPIAEALYQVADSYYRSLMDSVSVGGYRMAISHRVQQTNLPAVIWREGPARIEHSITQWLESRADLPLNDPQEAAEMFLAMIPGRTFHARSFGQPVDMDAATVERRLRNAVRRFLAAYAVG